MSGEEVEKYLSSAWSNLQTCENAYQDLVGTDPSRNSSAIDVISTFGRATTSALQRLRSRVDGFDEWYGEYVDEMRSDPLLLWFYNARTEATKRGEATSREYVSSYVPSVIINEEGAFKLPGLPPIEIPREAESFIGAGIIGWEVETSEGTERYEIPIPGAAIEYEVELKNSPEKHRGKDISESDAEEMCRMYIDYLIDMMQDAHSRFKKQ